MTLVPSYWAEACDHLKHNDRVMNKLIPQFSDVCLQSRGDPFTTLARSVIGQQISVKAAQAVWDRFATLMPRMEPAQLLRLKVDDMRGAGLSARKVEYLVDLALHFDNGTLRPEAWQDMDDEAIVKQLVAIRGIGRWTAEMFLIFYLMRPNVLPLDDVGDVGGTAQLALRVGLAEGTAVAIGREGMYQVRNTGCPPVARVAAQGDGMAGSPMVRAVPADDLAPPGDPARELDRVLRGLSTVHGDVHLAA